MPEMRLRCARVAQTGAPERFELHAEALDAWLAVVMYSPQAEHIVHERDALAFQQVRETGASTPYEKECLLRDGTRIAIEIGLATTASCWRSSWMSARGDALAMSWNWPIAPWPSAPVRPRPRARPKRGSCPA